MAEQESSGPFSNRRLSLIIITVGMVFLAGYPILSIEVAAAPVLPGQNACDGVLRTYGRCEQSLNGNSITIPSSGKVSFQVNYSTPFTNVPFVTIEPLNNPFSGLGQSNDVMLAQNGTRTSGTCIGCTTFTFPAANTMAVIPSSSGYISINGGFDFATNQFPLTPTWATLNINVVSISNVTSNGRNLWVQGFDPDAHGDLSCVGQWEDLQGIGIPHRPGLTNNGQAPIFNWGVGFFHGDRGTFGGIVDTAVPTQINQTIIADAANSYPTCQSNGDLMLRVVGSLTSGHETITYNTLYVTFYYPAIAGQVSVQGLSSTSFTVLIVGAPSVTVSFAWKAYSESG